MADGEFLRLDENKHETPDAGTWLIKWRGGRIAPLIGCPLCGACIGATKVGHNGEVDGTLFCEACPWWGYAQLEQWAMIRQIYGEKVTDSGELTNAPVRPDLSKVPRKA